MGVTRQPRRAPRPYLTYAVQRVVQAVVVVLLAYCFTFLVISVLPGDPVTATLRNPQNNFTEEEVQRIVAYYGLDRPVWVQLWEALSRFVQGDLGVSLRSNLPVSTLIGDVLGSTVVLAVSALVVALALAFGIAYGTRNAPAPVAKALRAFPSLFLSVPNFVIGLLLINVFAFNLGLFQVIDSEGPAATFFAAIALGIPVSAQVAEVLIANLDHEARQDYAGFATSRGLSRSRLFWRHLLKPSSLPVVTVIALTVGELLGGALITETIFGRTGIGSLVQRSVTTQDLPVLQAVVVLAAVVFVVVNLVVDLVYPLLDPRVDLRGAARAPRTAAEQPLETTQGASA
ncbi:ABC transporter permease [Nocardioides flavescens]|uniref:ABC transporter permease subunit n=1 Tax=Nocardioides flavescens TaxID=2691959 RepID=A0A6L7F335_9ACTN|nr:ABC transporter permease [Nocardioides flavescens]MXG90904.1 ABC transporter permease subunit [Nocardioides flavescens]